MSTEKGLGKIYKDGVFFAQVIYELEITEAESGHEEITGTIEVIEEGPDFIKANLIFTLELESGRCLPFWVKDPHPVGVSPLYEIAIAPG